MRMKIKENDEGKIVENLEELNESLASQNSAKSFLVKGMLYGVGFVVGSTILAAILFSVLNIVLGDVPIIGKFISDSL
jgi:hypothetical protein